MKCSIRCANFDDARYVIDMAAELCSMYGHVSFGDLRDLVGEHANRTDYFIGWDLINSDKWMIHERNKNYVIIRLPEPNWYKHDSKESEENEYAASEPLNIIIDTAKLEYLDETVECVLEHARAIKDRPVRITIC